MSVLNDHHEGLVLHSRYFTDSKIIVTLFTPSHGKIVTVYRKSKKKEKITPFTLFECTWSGKGNLKSLYSAEVLRQPFTLVGRSLFCGIYLNEILHRLLPENHISAPLYQLYVETLEKLSLHENDGAVQQVLLRRFEFFLLRELGVGVDFYKSSSNKPLGQSADQYYCFDVSRGFVEVDALKCEGYMFSAKVLSDMANEVWNGAALKSAKIIARLALAPLLGNKPVKARELFQ